jgi:16S rRNA (cytosine1402-N4)-methyltransferase
MDSTPHQSVLYKEIIHALQPVKGGRYVDGTLGAGGHARGIMEASAPDGQLLGLDVDPQALAIARKTLAPYEQRIHLVQASYASLSNQLAQLGWNAVDGILLDLGASSMQFDTPERGFSFMQDAPLDMRFGPDMEQTAADLVNGLSERELADLIYQYGEERDSRKIARAIVKARPLHTTRELVAVIEKETKNVSEKDALDCVLGYTLGTVIPDIQRYIHWVIAVVIVLSILPAAIESLHREKQETDQ